MKWNRVMWMNKGIPPVEWCVQLQQCHLIRNSWWCSKYFSKTCTPEDWQWWNSSDWKQGGIIELCCWWRWHPCRCHSESSGSFCLNDACSLYCDFFLPSSLLIYPHHPRIVLQVSQIPRIVGMRWSWAAWALCGNSAVWWWWCWIAGAHCCGWASFVIHPVNVWWWQCLMLVLCTRVWKVGPWRRVRHVRC